MPSLIDQGGILRFGASRQSGVAVPSVGALSDLATPELKLTPGQPANDPPIVRYKRVALPPTDDKTRVWTYTEGDDVLRLETPTNISMPLWQLLEHYVQYLKPREEGTHSSPLRK